MIQQQISLELSIIITIIYHIDYYDLCIYNNRLKSHSALHGGGVLMAGITVIRIPFQVEVSLEEGIYPAEVAAVVALVLWHTTALTSAQQKTGVQDQEHTPTMQAQSLISKLRMSSLICNCESYLFLFSAIKIDSPAAVGFTSIKEEVVGK